MTEDQAKTKWCPFAITGIYAGNSAIAINRHVSDLTSESVIEEATRCIASSCMMWRLHPAGPHGSGNCGLAGKSVY